jgi:N-acetylglucosamine kinase-like BadF-type ATPase
VEAVKDIMRTEDRGRPTSLTERIFEHWNLGSLDELVRRANASPPPDFASLFPAVLALEAHDAVAGAILQRAGRALADLAAVVHRTLWSSDSVVPIAMSGGVFHHSATVCRQFEGRLQSLNLPARVYLNHTNPAEGALSLARKMVAVSG